MVILLILLHLEMGDLPIHQILPMANLIQTLHLLHLMGEVEEVVVMVAVEVEVEVVVVEVVVLPIHLLVLTILLFHHMVAIFLHKEALQQTPEQLPKS